ncbi:MAG: heme-binding protein [Planctomycetaceae bacterium]|nr:heme-binding protein [Planctomycetaceae bacterium]
MTLRKSRPTILLTLLVSSVIASFCYGWQYSEPVPQWIWSSAHNPGHVPTTACYFRHVVRLPADMTGARIGIAADDAFEIYINGRKLGEGTNERGIVSLDASQHVRSGENLIAVKVLNRKGSTAGLALRLVASQPGDQQVTLVTDGNWRTSLSPLPLWNRNSYSDRRWTQARRIGEFSDFAVKQQQDRRRQERTAEKESAEQSTRPVAANDDKTPSASGSQRTLVRLPASGEQLEVPREFELEQVAGHRDVGSLIAMTFNEFGHIIASKENGSLLLLYGNNEDGSFSKVREYADGVKNCHGILAVNGAVYVTGQGPQGSGLYRLTDSSQNAFLDKVELLLKFEGKNIEHGPHGLMLGPDGLIYGVVGNHSQLEVKADAASPYQHYYEGDLLQPKLEDPGGHAAGIKAPGGVIFRCDPQGEQVELIAGGLRNAYDLAINASGEIFTHDSDMESDEGTTWSRPTRLYHVISGAEFGWRSGWSKWPESHLDGMSGIADTGRGSPSGITIYEHKTFPEEYRNTVFSCDWTEGEVLAIRLKPDGATYHARPKTFIRGTPLNVTDVEVGPDGALYLATGGRGTAGNIYRVSWKGNRYAESDLGEGIDRVVKQPQINSSWARQRVAQIRQQLGDRWDAEITQAALSTERDPAERVQALRIMRWMGPNPDLKMLLALTQDQDSSVRRQAVYELGLLEEAEAAQRLTELLNDQDPLVRRHACEAMVRMGHLPTFDRIKHMLVAKDRSEAWVARRMLERMPKNGWIEQVLTTDDHPLFLRASTAVLIADPDPETAKAILNRTMVLMDGFINDQNFIDLLRVQQLALLRGELTRTDVPLLRQRLSEEYPSSSHVINRELIRLLAYLQMGTIKDRYLAELQSDIPDVERLHLAIHLTRIPANWTTTEKLAIFEQLNASSQSGNSLPGYLQNVARDFGKTFTDEEITAVLEQGARVPGAALAALFRLPDDLSDEQVDQIKDLDEQLMAGDNNSETIRRLKVGIVAVLARDGSDSAFAYLREVFDRDPSRRVEVALGLAEAPQGDNWDVLVRSLPVLDNQSAVHVISRLKTVDRKAKKAESYRQLLLVAQQLGNQDALQAIALLEKWQGYAMSDTTIPSDKALGAWKAWFVDTFPEEPLPELAATTGGKWDYDALLKHLESAQLESTGSVDNGRLVFEKIECAKCHRFETVGESMGPDLTTVRKRFLTKEILDSIIYPSKIISDQYAAQTLFTEDGRTFTGIVAPAGEDEVVVLQANGQKVRIQRAEIDESEPSRTSAMPSGLLDSLTLQEITDLFAYLSSGTDRISQNEQDSELQQR